MKTEGLKQEIKLVERKISDLKEICSLLYELVQYDGSDIINKLHQNAVDVLNFNVKIKETLKQDLLNSYVSKISVNDLINVFEKTNEFKI